MPESMNKPNPRSEMSQASILTVKKHEDASHPVVPSLSTVIGTETDSFHWI